MDLHRDEIPRAAWQPFMDRFSRAHRGWRVTLGTIHTQVLERAMETAAHTVSADALFEGLRLDRRVDGEHLTVLLGLPNALTTHAVHAPQRLFVERTGSGAEEALRVDSADGTTLLLRFRAGARPEQLDGLAPGEWEEPVE
jgi:hypothetical protein